MEIEGEPNARVRTRKESPADGQTNASISRLLPSVATHLPPHINKSGAVVVGHTFPRFPRVTNRPCLPSTRPPRFGRHAYIPPSPILVCVAPPARIPQCAPSPTTTVRTHIYLDPHDSPVPPFRYHLPPPSLPSSDVSHADLAFLFHGDVNPWTLLPFPSILPASKKNSAVWTGVREWRGGGGGGGVIVWTTSAASRLSFHT